jgi:DNA-binding MarR family transcriptional regulator
VRILDRMERAGWIERCGAPQDLRKKIVRPTEKVAATWAHIVERGERMETRATAGLSLEELENLKKTLATMRRNLGGST